MYWAEHSLASVTHYDSFALNAQRFAFKSLCAKWFTQVDPQICRLG